MKRMFFMGLAGLLFATAEVRTQEYKTGVLSEQIRTLTVYPNGDWSQVPVIADGSDSYVEIAFDELSHQSRKFAYRIIHCNADWTRSDINELEYMDGFPENDIEEAEQSVSTLTLYTHYRFSIPNDRVKLKLSGNYAVEVFDRDGNGEAFLKACFSVLEEKVAIEGNVTATTEVDIKQTHQQLDFNVNTARLNIRRPSEELKVAVQQNRRRDNEVRNIVPFQVGAGIIRYEHTKELIFEAGNEYRRFEATSYKYPGLGVNRIEYFKPFYNVELFPSEARTKGYVYDKDQNGRCLVHTLDGSDDEIGADYYLVHFSIPMDTPILDGAFFLNGDFVYNRMDGSTKMVYNFERKAYEKALLLKQGAYNYLYMFRPSKKDNPSSPLRLEGSFWETENEYQVYVYYRPIGEQYDRLIGFKQIQTAF